MRIAIVSTPFIRVPPIGYGGTELFCYELSEALFARGHDVTLFTTGDSEVSCRKRWLYASAQWPPHPHDEANHVAWALSEATSAGVDVVHINSPLGIPFQRFTLTPLVHTLHHHQDDATSRLYRAHPAVHYVAISRRQLDLEAPLARATVIHHGLLPERYPPADGDEGYLLHLGRYAPEKGTHLAIDIARLASLPLKLAGRTHPPDVSYVATHVAPRLAWPGVEELGEAHPKRKLALLSSARAIVCPLQWEEPFGLIAIEAMLCGTPVLGFARGSFPEIVDEGVTGFLAAPGDIESLARRARELASFDRAACAQRARQRFSTSVMASAYEALYERAVAWPRSERVSSQVVIAT